MYVGNQNTTLAFRGSLVDGAQTCRPFGMSCTGASFCLLVKHPKLQAMMSFYCWYVGTNTVGPTYYSRYHVWGLIIETFERLIKELALEDHRPPPATGVHEYMQSGWINQRSSSLVPISNHEGD